MVKSDFGYDRIVDIFGISEAARKKLSNYCDSGGIYVSHIYILFPCGTGMHGFFWKKIGISSDIYYPVCACLGIIIAVIFYEILIKKVHRLES